MRRVLLAVGLALGLAGCTPGPVETVDDYFRSLRDDPVRTLILTSEAFHERHGVRRVPPLRPGGRPPAPAPDAAEAEAGGRLARARLGWLLMIKMSTYHELAERLRVEHVSVDSDAEQATVVTRVSAPGATPFLQTFVLRRSARDGRWRIDEIVQQDVRIGSRAPAYAAYPSQANHEAAIERARQVKEAARLLP